MMWKITISILVAKALLFITCKCDDDELIQDRMIDFVSQKLGVVCLIEESNGQTKCYCRPGYVGDPKKECVKEGSLESRSLSRFLKSCTSSSMCPEKTPYCRRGKCVDPCPLGVCGSNADCQVVNGVPACSCPAFTTGDPFQTCRPLKKGDICKPSPCGINAKCKVVDLSAFCYCPPGFSGRATQQCMPND